MHTKVHFPASGKFSITQSLHDGTSGLSATLATGLDLADGNWHNVRFVIEYNGTDSCVVLYVDGVGVSSKNTYFWDSVVTDGTPLKSVTWRVCNNLSKEGVKVMDFYDLYVDNMYFVYAGEIK